MTAISAPAPRPMNGGVRLTQVITSRTAVATVANGRSFGLFIEWATYWGVAASSAIVSTP